LTGDELTTVARSRAIEPARLSKLIRGELDWIVLKAIDKDRSRRYETRAPSRRTFAVTSMANQ
jgi:hypothetical protein